MSEFSQYISTRGGIEPLGFNDAVLMGLATDGGLLLPRQIPDLSADLEHLRCLDYPHLAAEVMRPFVGPALTSDELLDLVTRSYASFSHPDVIPLVQVGSLEILELFHGPTLAFKDVALQFLGNLFERILEQTQSHLNILGATSGDTGSAAIAGVRGKSRMHIFIMHPHGRVSPTQERQMTTVLDANVHNMAVDGTFDDGQRVMKEVFNDLPFREMYRLGAVNSVNWARVLAQVVYYFHGAFRALERSGASSVQVAVPTGNFGDIFAGFIARRMGAPVSRLILATNENDILARFFNTGVYKQGTVQATVSPSMDIQVASNFERYLFYRTGEDPLRVKELMEDFARTGELRLEGNDATFTAGAGTTAETMETISRYYRDYNYLLDPHTAVGVAVAKRLQRDGEPTVCLATAHPAKFSETIRNATGEDAARHAVIDKLSGLSTRCKVLPATKTAVQTFIRDTLSA